MSLYSPLLFLLLAVTAAAGPMPRGTWQILQNSIGIVAMHIQLVHNDRVIILDRTDFGASNISLPSGKCRWDPRERRLKYDCTAHSVEYNFVDNTVRPLFVQTDVWCSSGTVTSDGTLVQTGGSYYGDRAVRLYSPCDQTTSSCDWREQGDQLFDSRWYATNHILPGGRVIIIGGRGAFNYEFYPRAESSRKSIPFPFLVQTNDPGIENNLYPFVFLNTDGNLFIFANTKSILFNYTSNAVIRTYPEIPGSRTESRNYPSTGSAVLLPFRVRNSSTTDLEILICGGTPKTAFLLANDHKRFVRALDTCGRMKINDPNPVWLMERMPMPRFMSDMVILPNGQVLIINGAASGSAGWDFGRDPVLSPVLYKPDCEPGSRFDIMERSQIARMYHSTAALIRDGRVLVGGGNPHEFYNFTGVLYPTELRLEAYSPPYLDPNNSAIRPAIVAPASQSRLGYGAPLNVGFTVSGGAVNVSAVEVTLLAPPFNTHSFSMNQRMLVLGAATPVMETTAPSSGGVFTVTVTAPGSPNLAPEGYYLLFVVHQGIPSEGIWVQLQ